MSDEQGHAVIIAEILRRHWDLVAETRRVGFDDMEIVIIDDGGAENPTMNAERAKSENPSERTLEILKQQREGVCTCATSPPTMPTRRAKHHWWCPAAARLSWDEVYVKGRD